MGTAMRLDRFLSEMGADTRSRIREACRKKQVLVNGEIEKSPERKIDPERDQVIYQGEPVIYAAVQYYMLNKPAGVLTATEDRRAGTVLDLLDLRTRKDLFPVGRLDKDTEGLLLITNDGPLCRRLLSPKNHVEKVYYARVAGRMEEGMIPRFAEGLDIGDEKLTLPAKLEILACRRVSIPGIPGEAWESEIRLTLTEGRFHQVKRMVQAVGCEVTFLKRLRMGSLELDPGLKPGEFRPLTREEVHNIRIH